MTRKANKILGIKFLQDNFTTKFQQSLNTNQAIRIFTDSNTIGEQKIGIDSQWHSMIVKQTLVDRFSSHDRATVEDRIAVSRVKVARLQARFSVVSQVPIALEEVAATQALSATMERGTTTRNKSTNGRGNPNAKHVRFLNVPETATVPPLQLLPATQRACTRSSLPGKRGKWNFVLFPSTNDGSKIEFGIVSHCTDATKLSNFQLTYGYSLTLSVRAPDTSGIHTKDDWQRATCAFSERRASCSGGVTADRAFVPKGLILKIPAGPEWLTIRSNNETAIHRQIRYFAPYDHEKITFLLEWQSTDGHELDIFDTNGTRRVRRDCVSLASRYRPVSRRTQRESRFLRRSLSAK